jgi:hypothetical protein
LQSPVRPVGAVEVTPAQYFPAVQATQSVFTDFYVLGLYVPDGHILTNWDPKPQYPPTGHSLPVVPSVGVEVKAP